MWSQPINKTAFYSRAVQSFKKAQFKFSSWRWIQFQCIWEKINFNYCSTLRSTILNRVQFKESGVPTSIKREGTTEKLCVLAKKIQVIKFVLRTHFLKSPFALRCMRYCILYACMLQYESCSFPRWLLLNW